MYKKKLCSVYISVDEKLAFIRNVLGIQVNVLPKQSTEKSSLSGKRQMDQKSDTTKKPKSPEWDSSRPCNACGRPGHKASKKTCIFVHADHPERSRDLTSWKDSTVGKKWKAADHSDLPPRKLLNGSNWDFDSAKRNFLDDPTTIKGDMDIHHIYSLSKNFKQKFT